MYQTYVPPSTCITDSFLRARNSQDHEATAMMKAQFMSLWDGLITDPSCTVIIMGATNRPQELDRAILRRMPATFHFGLPVNKISIDPYHIYCIHMFR